MSDTAIQTPAFATHTLRSATSEALTAAGLDPADVVRVIRRAVEEDLGEIGDVTSAATISEDAVLSARYVAREPGTVAGLPVLAAALDSCLGPTATLRLLKNDGDQLEAGDALAEIVGPARGVLAIERLSLNLLGHLSGVASLTHAWVDAVASTSAQIRDTRKTTPGLRDLEKYAVRCGGGVNHRRGLDDAVLIKDNHVASAGGVGAALDRVHAAYPVGQLVVQVEVDDAAQLEEALDHGATQILLDNFSEADLVAAVARVRERAPGVMLEASGGLRLDRAAAVARTGVDFLAVGALTHSARSLDIGLDTTP
jgi:nicotinate-nucleotide pyrophosphorylase (carboxylating)